MPTLELDQHRLHYYVRGQGPDVLMIHGWASSLRMWERPLHVLAAAGFRAWALDLPGHGASSPPACEHWYTIPNLAAVVQVGSVSTVAEAYGNAVKIGSYVYVIANVWGGGSSMQIINVSNPAAPVNTGSVVVNNGAAIGARNGKLFLFEGIAPTVRVYSLANPLAPVVEASSTVSFSGSTATLGITPLTWSSADWVGNYLVGMTYGSAAAYHGARALNFTVN